MSRSHPEDWKPYPFTVPYVLLLHALDVLTKYVRQAGMQIPRYFVFYFRGKIIKPRCDPGWPWEANKTRWRSPHRRRRRMRKEWLSDGGRCMPPYSIINRIRLLNSGIYVHSKAPVRRQCVRCLPLFWRSAGNRTLPAVGWRRWWWAGGMLTDLLY